MRFSLYRALRLIVLSAASLLLMGIFSVPPAHAADYDIEIESGSREGDPGTLLTLATRDIAPEFRGQQCKVIGTAVNQHSVHPNSDLFVRSGGTEVVLRDVESAPNVTVEGEGTLTLGEEIVVLLRFGEDGVFSGGMTVTVDCPETSRIVVIKEVTEGSSTTQAFEFTASWDSDGFALSDGEQHHSGELEPGRYSLSENVPDGWELGSAVCDDSNSPLPEINLLAGETVTCVFTNDELPDDEVGAAIVVTVAGGCEVIDDEAVGEITASIPVAGGAEIVITDSDGEVVETFTEDGTVTVPDGQYTWVATPAEGFEFPEGFESTGTVTVICDQVLASILVTVSADCEIDGGEGVGRISVVMSVAGGADVVIRDSGGDILGSLDADGTITVPEGARYTWEATPAEGFEFAPGSPDSGAVTVDTCSTEVLPITEVLPFTGVDAYGVAATGVLMLLAGAFSLLAARKFEEPSPPDSI